ncbi:MAG: hypothetical protein EZS28_033272 [Streblomastix strix]|uniref:Uncharacterized protein n=1 Tax=Streblomastix strix TaxID=222440 RepID=A0A5J4UMB4_9EUKA|nr:MAG: hypothetical protein EZS28_033272 [Streblomastix strix]
MPDGRHYGKAPKQSNMKTDGLGQVIKNFFTGEIISDPEENIIIHLQVVIVVEEEDVQFNEKYYRLIQG